MINRCNQLRVKFPQLATQTVIAFTDSDTRRETYIHGGWNLADDDVPHRPEVDPMASAQSRRARRQSPPADCPER